MSSAAAAFGTALQVRPNEFVRFKKISLEEAFSAVFRTDALVEALTSVARGTLTLQQAQQQLDTFKVGAGPWPCCTAVQHVWVRLGKETEGPAQAVTCVPRLWLPLCHT